MGRDWLYLAAVFIGASVALSTRLFSGAPGERRRDRIIAASLGLLSPAVAAVGMAAVASDASVFFDRSLLIACACVVILSCLSVRFPRAIGFPCVVGIGAAIALIGYGVLSLPPVAEGAALGLLVVGEGDTISVRFDPPDGRFQEARVRGDPSPIQVETLHVRFHRVWPILGGAEQLALTTVRFGAEDTAVSAKNLPIEPLLHPEEGHGGELPSGIPGISVERLSVVFPKERLPAGTRLGIYRSKGALRLLP